MAQELQLDIFEEQRKADIAEKIKTEINSYEKKKSELTAERDATEQRLHDNDLSWQDRKEYQDDLQDYQRELESLERSHKRTLDELYAKQYNS